LYNITFLNDQAEKTHNLLFNSINSDWALYRAYCYNRAQTMFWIGDATTSWVTPGDCNSNLSRRVTSTAATNYNVTILVLHLVNLFRDKWRLGLSSAVSGSVDLSPLSSDSGVIYIRHSSIWTQCLSLNELAGGSMIFTHP